MSRSSALYLAPYGPLQIKSFKHQMQNLLKVYVAVLKPTTQNHRADNVGDGIVKSEVGIIWSSWREEKGKDNYR